MKPPRPTIIRDHLWASRRLEALLDAELAPRDRARVERHAEHCEHCEDCGRSLDTLRRLVGGLRALRHR